MVFNTSAAEVIDRSLARSTHHALIKQALYAVLGFFSAGGVWFLGYDNIVRLSRPFLVFGTVLLILVLIPGVGQQLNGARRWIGIGGFSFQPSEFVKILIPIYYVHRFFQIEKPIVLKQLLRLIGEIAIPLGLILIEPDNGTAAIIIATLIVLLVLTRVRFVYWGAPLLALLLVGGAVSSQMSHVGDRIRIYLHPELDLKGKGHQPHQAKIAAGSGGLWGKGLAESMQKLDFLPEARSDYIAAIFAEEFGFVGMTTLIFLYMTIAFCGFAIALNVADPKASLLAAIMTFLIVIQAFLNLGVVSGLLPSKGTNLPFFSQGGSSLLANFIMVCIILSISRTEQAHA